MNMTLWKKRQEIPDPQVRDAAEQFEQARRIMASYPPGTGVLLPLMNVAAIAIELFLKSLSSIKVYEPILGFPGGSRVFAVAETKGHVLESLLDSVPERIRQQLEGEYAAANGARATKTLREALSKYEGLFEASRYSFEPTKDISEYPFEPLMTLSEFLSAFVNALPPSEHIHFA